MTQIVNVRASIGSVLVRAGALIACGPTGPRRIRDVLEAGLDAEAKPQPAPTLNPAWLRPASESVFMPAARGTIWNASDSELLTDLNTFTSVEISDEQAAADARKRYGNAPDRYCGRGGPAPSTSPTCDATSRVRVRCRRPSV